MALKVVSRALALAAALTWHGSCARTPPPPAAARPPLTEEQCRACAGEWGVHGLAQAPSCNCRTADGGKRCTDGADCQGVCVAAPDDPEREVREAGPPARGFFVGRCSTVMTVFGCNRIIGRGARSRGLVALDEPPTMLCVD
jgi:hypothetical protein